jgi:ribonuclease HII
VAAVMLPDELRIEGLNDSKQLSPKKRESLARIISEQATAIGLAYVAPQDIDAYGITACLKTCFKAALGQVLEQLDDEEGLKVLIDGRPLGIDPREQAIVKGDGKIAAIAAASVYAKVHRDALMCKFAQEYPQYHFESNKGYGSAAHIAAIKEHGLCPLHRRSFCTNFI